MNNRASLDFLVVDDDPTLAAMLERALKRRQFSCAIAQDAHQALQLAEHHLIVKAIIDLKLGNDSGL